MNSPATQDANNTAPTLTFDVHFERKKRRKEAVHGKRTATEPGREVYPRQVRLLALAHHLERQLQRGIFRDYADIAALAGISRARVTQIMSLLYLAPNIQEQMLLNPEVARGWTDRDVQRMVKEVEWGRQSEVWRRLG